MTRMPKLPNQDQIRRADDLTIKLEGATRIPCVTVEDMDFRGLLLAARLAYPMAEALRNLLANPELPFITDTHQARTALTSWELAQP